MRAMISTYKAVKYSNSSVELTVQAMASSVSIFVLIFLIGSISAAKHPKVVGGENTVIKNYPFVVSIRTSDGQHNCGGSIISDTHILTAAHCVDYMDKDEIASLTIHSGTSRTDRVGNVHKIQSVHIHPTYDERPEVDGSDDIAVLTLKEPIVFNKYQQKINLPKHDVHDYQVAYVVGWGRTSTTTWDSAKQLQKLRMAVLSSQKCIPHLTDSRIDEKQICAYRSNKGSSCHGDSGGPLVSHGEIVGIVSRGDTVECADGNPEIYTNVYAFKDFIESVMNE